MAYPLLNFVPLTAYKVDPHENDGEKLFSLLRTQETLDGIRDCMGRIEGP